MHPAGDHRRTAARAAGRREAVVAGEGRGRRMRGRAGILVAAVALAVGYAGTGLARRGRGAPGAAVAGGAGGGGAPAGPVAGVRVGGLDRAAAVRLRQQRLAAAPATVALRAGARTAQLDR